MAHFDQSDNVLMALAGSKILRLVGPSHLEARQYPGPAAPLSHLVAERQAIVPTNAPSEFARMRGPGRYSKDISEAATRNQSRSLIRITGRTTSITGVR